MLLSKKIVAMAAGLLSALSAATVAQNAAPILRGSETLIVEDATVEWIEKSNVAALREGVIDRMELQIGMPVGRGKPIGYLHSEVAELTVAKAKVIVNGIAAEEKALAQRELALTVVATNERLNQRKPGMVSREEMLKAEAEVKVASAMVAEAVEKRKVDKADLDLAERTLFEHTIVAPFDGIVIERKKHPGESVRANEAVVLLGNLDKLRARFFIPAEYAYRVKEDQIVELQPRLTGTRGAKLPIETRKFTGKITFVDPEIQPVGETAVRVFAEFDNKDRLLRPGLKATVTIHLSPDAAAPVASAPAVGSRN